MALQKKIAVPLIEFLRGLATLLLPLSKSHGGVSAPKGAQSRSFSKGSRLISRQSPWQNPPQGEKVNADFFVEQG